MYDTRMLKNGKDAGNLWNALYASHGRPSPAVMGQVNKIIAMHPDSSGNLVDPKALLRYFGAK